VRTPLHRSDADAALNGRLKLRQREASPLSLDQSAFTLIEVMVGVGVMGIMIVSLYAGFAFGFQQIRRARENVRATQVLQERMEVIRLVNWNDLNSAGYIPTTFTEPFYADNPTNPPANSFYYTGTVQVTSAPLTETYSNNLRMVKIELTWPSGNLIRTRQMTTFVAQSGIQRYVY
jgi:uncharacterized protein (TIGR02598 family)